MWSWALFARSSGPAGLLFLLLGQRRLGNLAIIERRQHGEHIGLNQRVEQGEQYAYNDGQNKAQSHVIVYQLRHQQSAEQCAEQPEAHGDGQRKLLERFADSLRAVSGDGAGDNDQKGKGSHTDGGVDIREGGGQGDGVSQCGDGLNAQQLEKRSHKDVGSGAKDVRAQKAGAVGAAGARHAVKEAHRLLQQHLELSWREPEPGNGENPDTSGSQQQNCRDGKGGDQSRIDGFQSEKADPVGTVEHRVPHGFLHAFRPARRSGKQRTRQ